MTTRCNGNIANAMAGALLAGILLFYGDAWAVTSHQKFAGFALEDCKDCHEEKNVAVTHDAMWASSHRLYADKKPSNCADCHRQSFCTDCHFGGNIDADLHLSRSGPEYMPRSHRTDFREIHPIRAHDDPASCYRCHENRRFCNDCHGRFNQADLSVLSHRMGFSNLEAKSGGPRHESFNTSDCQTCHPNSVLPSHEWSGAHAREARKNLPSCQACHPEGNVCLKCHSAVSGLKENPHPDGWNRISNRMERASNRRTCVRCHP